METASATSPSADTSAPSVIAATFALGATRLAVRDANRSIAFYEDALGLDHLGTDGDIVRVGSGGTTVLELSVEPYARPAGRHAGLYHVALLYPSRIELARAGQRLMAQSIPIQGAADHVTHEAFYLPDPDGNGLELAADRPRDEWPTVERMYGNGPQPLDVGALMALVDGSELVDRAAPGIVVGHMHLHVANIDEAIAFYRDTVGFDLMARLPTAGFVAAAGYHHHLGFNTWQGEAVPPAPDDALGLRFWTTLVPSARDVDALAARLQAAGIEHEVRPDGALVTRDPAGNQLRVQPRNAPQ